MEPNRSGPMEGFHISGVELLRPYYCFLSLLLSALSVFTVSYDIEANFSLETINLRVALNNTNYNFT
jgi:hypothetical protein